MKTKSVNDILDRLKSALSLDSDQDLANALQVSKAAVSNWRKRNSLDYDRVFSICEHINLDWLLTGHGLMTESDDSTVHINQSSKEETRPRIPFEAAAGSLSIISQSVSEENCERFPIIKSFPDYDFTIMVKGDSMDPEFHSGDEVACRLVESPSFIQWGRPHVLDTNQGIVLKRIFNRKDTILCRSDNQFYEDFEIPKEDIYRIALVVGSMRLY